MSDLFGSVPETPDFFHIFILLDASSRMSGVRIDMVNEAMRKVLPAIIAAADKRELSVLAHILAYDEKVRWLCGTSATEYRYFEDPSWTDITAAGEANVAEAYESIVEAFCCRFMGIHGYAPIILHVTSGADHDPAATRKALHHLDWGYQSMRIAVDLSGGCTPEMEAFVFPKDLAPGYNPTICEGQFISVTDAHDLPGVIHSAVMSAIDNLIQVTKPQDDKLVYLMRLNAGIPESLI